MNDPNREIGGICVSIAGSPGNRVEDIVTAARNASPLADVIEIRLDTLSTPAVEPFTVGVQAPLLFTNRAAWEGGYFQGDDGERFVPLLKAAECQAAYVDLELKTDIALREELLAAVKKNSTKLIISWHNFDKTPGTETLSDILRQQRESGADIGKIVTMAHNSFDVLRVLNLQEQARKENFPLIAFCMGNVGMISRLATLQLGGYMTYAAPDDGTATAPGQLPVTELRNILMRLGYDT